MKIGQKLKEKRTELGLSQEELARRIGVSRQTVSSWENDRSYPDIGSLMKLTDLYGLSLDELLRQDSDLRNHVEDTAKWSRKGLNTLQGVLTLLLPLGYILGRMGLNGIGVMMQVAALVLLPPLWLVRWKVLGTDRTELRHCLSGWGMVTVSAVIGNILPDDSVASAAVKVVLAVVQAAGLFTILANGGLRVERRSRLWLVVAMVAGILVTVRVGAWIERFALQGVFSEAQPFGKEYIVAQVLQEPEEPVEHRVQIKLDALNNRLYIDQESKGVLLYTDPTGELAEQYQGIWEGQATDQANATYKLTVDRENTVILSYIEDDSVCWRWALAELEELQMHYSLSESYSIGLTPDWYYPDTFDLESFLFTGEQEDLQMRWSFTGDADSLTVTEAYYYGGEWEIREFTLTREENGSFYHDLQWRDDSDGQYVLYAIPWLDGYHIEGFCYGRESTFGESTE